MSEKENLNRCMGGDLPELIWHSTRPYEKEKFRIAKVVRGNPRKPLGGLWASPVLSEEDSDKSAWQQWCSENSYDEHTSLSGNFYRVEPHRSAHVLVIDSIEDFRQAISVYANTDVPRFADIGLEDHLFLDWLAIAKDFDAFYLTEKGQQETHFTSLYGWDCATVWFTKPSFAVIAHADSSAL